MGPTNVKEQPYRVERITVPPCFNAAGQWIPPYILFPRKRIPTQYKRLECSVAGSCYSLTEKGYMDIAALYSWLDKHFIPHLPPLLVDSAGAHIVLDTFELATKNGVYIYKLLKKCYSPRLAGGCWFARRHDNHGTKT